jgi:hypothetical protein
MEASKEGWKEENRKRRMNNVKWERKIWRQKQKSRLYIWSPARCQGYNLAVYGTYCASRDTVRPSLEPTNQCCFTSCISRPIGHFVYPVEYTRLHFPQKVYFLQLGAILIVFIINGISYFQDLTSHPADQVATGCEAQLCTTGTVPAQDAQRDGVNQLTQFIKNTEKH